WRDLIVFYEYFHGDDGAGLGASHQTGWTGEIAPLIDLFARRDAKWVLETERAHVLARVITEQVAGETVGAEREGRTRRRLDCRPYRVVSMEIAPREDCQGK